VDIYAERDEQDEVEEFEAETSGRPGSGSRT